MGDMNFPDPNTTTEHDGWEWDGEKWTRWESGGSAIPTVEKVATGTLANGDAVVLNADGTVSVVGDAFVGATTGTPTALTPRGLYRASVFDPATKQVALFESDFNNSQKLTVAIGKVSEGNITFGSSNVLNGEVGNGVRAVMLPDSKVFVAYQGPSNQGKAHVITITDGGFSGGKSTTFDGYAGLNSIGCVYDYVSDRVIVGYQDNRTGFQGRVCVGTITGTSITFQTPLLFKDTNCQYFCFSQDPVNGDLVMFHASSEKGIANIITVSGNTISWGADVEWNPYTPQHNKAVFDTVSGKHVVFTSPYPDNYLTVNTGTVSGGVLSFDTPVVVRSVYGSDYEPAFDPSTGNITVPIGSTSSPYTLFVYTITVDNGITVDGLTECPASVWAESYITATFDVNANTTVVTYRGELVTESVTFKPPRIETNLTSDNFLGFSDNDYNNGDTAKVLVNGSISQQSGLTTAKHHYVQDDGTVDTDDTGVFAGTALSSSELIVEGSNHG
jgi:hypothetical protein